MKKITAILLLTLCVMMGSLDLQAQKKRTGSRGKAKARTTATALKVVAGATHNYGSILTTKDFTCKKGDSYFTVEYPISGNATIVNALRKDIVARICPKFSGSLDTPDALLRKALAGYARKGQFGMSGETIECDIKITYATDKVVTINESSYFYGGGAHGMPLNTSTTYLVSTGQPLTRSMLPSIQTLRPYIINGLLRYADISRSEWDSFYFTTTKDLELPESDPYITKEGLNIIYSAYEIGPYAIGMPVATIPFSDVKRFAGKELLKYLP